MLNTKMLFRWGVSIIPLLALIGLTSSLSEHALGIIWQFTLITTILFYIACATIPAIIRQLQSMPYTFNLNNNWGSDGLEVQLLTYASYHTQWYNHITHTAFPIEAFLWQLVLYSYLSFTLGPLVAIAALVSVSLVLIIQAISFKEALLTRALILWWLCVAAMVLIITHVLSLQSCYHWSVILLISMGFWRFTGHWIEPIPPALIDNINFVSFKQAGFNIRLLSATLLGFFSEFAAGLPFRLVNVWIYVGLQQRCKHKRFTFSWYQAKNIRIAIHKKGWHGHPKTKQLIAKEAGFYDGNRCAK